MILMLWLFTLPLSFTSRIGAQEQSNQAYTSEQKAAKPKEGGTVADEETMDLAPATAKS